MAFTQKLTDSIASEPDKLEPIFEIEDDKHPPNTKRASVQKRSPSLKRKKDAHQFVQVDSPTSGRKIISRPIRTPKNSVSSSPPKEFFFQRGSSTDSSLSPTKAGSPPTTPPIARRALSRQNLKPSTHLNRGNSVWEMLSHKIRDNRNHHPHRKSFFHHRSQPQKALTFDSREAIKTFIDTLKDSDRYRPLEIDFTGSEIRSSQFQVFLNHVSLKKCTSLILDGCSHLNVESFTFIFERSRKVQYLDLSNLDFNHHNINQSIATLILAHRKTLLSLNFSNSYNLDYSVFQAILQCSKLQFLNVSYSEFQYYNTTSRFFESLLNCTDMYLLHLLNKNMRACLKLVSQLESLELSKQDWDRLLTFRDLGITTNILSLSDMNWQTLVDFRKNPDIREAICLPQDNWNELLRLKETIQTEVDQLNLPSWRWQDVYHLWARRNSITTDFQFTLEDLEKITSANERLARLNLSQLQFNLLSLPEDIWQILLGILALPDQKAALKLNDTAWELLLDFRAFSAPEWRALSLSQLKLSSLNLSSTDFALISFLHQHLSFLSFRKEDYTHFFNGDKFSFEQLKAFMLMNAQLRSYVGSNTALTRLFNLHQGHCLEDVVPDIFITLSESVLALYPDDAIDNNLTSTQVMSAFRQALSTAQLPQDKTNSPFKQNLSALSKMQKALKNTEFFDFLQARVNFLPVLLSACPDLRFLDVSSFLMPFHFDDIQKIENHPLETFVLNDLEWVTSDVSAFQSLFKHTPHLRSLSFANSGNSQDLPFYQSSLPKLTHLNISHQNRLFINSLTQYDQHFRKLEEINLSFCRLLPEFPLVLFLLRNGKNLKSLELDIPRFSFKNLRFLLKGIPLNSPIQGLGPQLTSLTISDLKLSPKRLKKIIHYCPNLQYLNNIDLPTYFNTQDAH